MRLSKNVWIYLLLLVVVYAGTLMSGTVKSAGVKGKWSVGATWIGGVLPGPQDMVVIADADTVTIDTSTTIANLTVGEGAGGTCQFSKTGSYKIQINGNLLVNAAASLRVQTRTGTDVIDTIVITGDITNNGSTFDLRSGSAGSTLSVCNIVFTGSGISTITMNGTYSSTLNEFNGFLFDKSGPGKVVLASDVYSATGSTSQPTGDPIWTFSRGRVYTGKYKMISQSTTNAHVGSGSDSSYIVGTLGRGMSNSAGKTGTFPVGDEKGYRPLKVTATTSGIASGHFVIVEAVYGNANSGSSTFSNGIDKVSAVRYYKVSYNKGASGAATMTFNKYAPSYGLSDGVAAGNQNLRVAISDSGRSVWNNVGPSLVTPYTTALDSLPRYITSDTSASTTVTLTSGIGSILVALARVTGTTENSLVSTGTSVQRGVENLSAFVLSQNYPNPFNPETSISFTIPERSNVTVEIYSLIGTTIAVLQNGTMNAGAHTLRWNASTQPSGVYFYRVIAGQTMSTKRMILLK